MWETREQFSISPRLVCVAPGLLLVDADRRIRRKRLALRDAHD